MLLISAFVFGQSANAECDFSVDIKENVNNTYTYSKECHIQAGKAVKLVPLLEEKIDNLEKKIELKDLLISKQEERASLWMDTALKLNDKIQAYEKINATERWTYLILGAGAVAVSVWAAGQIYK